MNRSMSDKLSEYEEPKRKRINRMNEKIIRSGFLIQVLKKNCNIKEIVKKFGNELDTIISEKKLTNNQFYTSFETEIAVNEIRQKLLEYYDIKIFKEKNKIGKEKSKITDFKSFFQFKDELIKKYELSEYEIETESIDNLQGYLSYLKEVDKDQTSKEILYNHLINSVTSGKEMLEQSITKMKNFYLLEVNKLHEKKINPKYLTLSFNKEFRDQIFLNIDNYFRISIGSKCKFSEKEKIKKSYEQYLREYINNLKIEEILKNELIKNNPTSIIEVEELFLFFLENKTTRFAIECDLYYGKSIFDFVSENNLIKKFNSLNKKEMELKIIFFINYKKQNRILSFENMDLLQETLDRLKMFYFMELYNSLGKEENLFEIFSLKKMEKVIKDISIIEELIKCSEEFGIYYGLQELKALFFIISLKKEVSPYKKTIEKIVLDIKKYQEKKIVSEMTDVKKNIYLRKVGFIRELILMLTNEKEYTLFYEVKKSIFYAIEEIEKTLYPEVINELLEKFYYDSIEFLEKEYLKVTKQTSNSKIKN